MKDKKEWDCIIIGTNVSFLVLRDGYNCWFLRGSKWSVYYYFLDSRWHVKS